MKFIKDHLLHKAHSVPHFIKLIQDNGMHIKYDRGVPTGIEDTNGQKYSWKKLGISPADFHALDHKARLHRIDERLQKLEQARNGKQHDKTIDH